MYVCVYAYTATHCNKLQHTATHCNTLQHTYLTHVLQFVGFQARMFVYICTLQHIATHCNKLQHTAAHIPHARLAIRRLPSMYVFICVHCNTLQCTATHCNTHTSRTSCHSEASQHVRVYMCTLQHSDHTVTHRNTLQHIATHIPHERLAIGRLSSKPIGSGGVSVTCQAPVAVCCGVLQCVVEHCSVLQRRCVSDMSSPCCSVLRCVAVCCRALQRVAAAVRQ